MLFRSVVGDVIIANANQKRPSIVILADRDKVEMEDDIKAKFASTGNTRIICRSGDPLDLDDLAVVDPHGARSIIVLAPEEDNPDLHVIKSVLAITNNPERKVEPVAMLQRKHHFSAVVAVEQRRPSTEPRAGDGEAVVTELGPAFVLARKGCSAAVADKA